MDVYIARQPIFDKNLKLYGYELLYRQSNLNYFSGVNDDQATAELIYNSIFVMDLNDITDGTLGFINFSKELIDSELPYLLPPQNIVIEVLEREEANHATIDACKKLRAMGYRIALDDFIFDAENSPLIEMADIIKIEYPVLARDVQQDLIREYHPRIKFLAEKIETREEYKVARDMGYDFFQGYFFSKPAMIGSKEIVPLNTNIFQIISELTQPEPQLQKVAEIVECDMGLSYKLLRLVNSIYFGAVNRINTIHQALVYIGTHELYQWFSFMLLKDMRNVESAEVVKLSLIRGKLMDLLARELHNGDGMDYFFTGMFSFIDVLLNRPLKEILDSLPLADKVKAALLGEDNDCKELLDCVIDCESGAWDDLRNHCPLDQIGSERFMELYLEAIKWAKKLNY